MPPDSELVSHLVNEIYDSLHGHLQVPPDDMCWDWLIRGCSPLRDTADNCMRMSLCYPSQRLKQAVKGRVYPWSQEGGQVRLVLQSLP